MFRVFSNHAAPPGASWEGTLVRAAGSLQLHAMPAVPPLRLVANLSSDRQEVTISGWPVEREPAYSSGSLAARPVEREPVYSSMAPMLPSFNEE